ncbi:aluminum-activated malate transporter 2-like [Mercurialis annua]|uniref:aluminum-activated malate transporter 2-like n=1 Tax=Mercurialis annua TaxID=3986 RepID=UPI00215DE57C|nr:aluminum-activated malate transporter 2-like [Mercurialis annua]
MEVGSAKPWPVTLKAKMEDFGRSIKKVGEDDPRRVIHSLKVGFALTLVSIFYYYQPLYQSFGVSAMWAVMTVVVVFEFSVGATLGKGLNRVMATLLAGALGVGAHHLADLTGHIGEPILLGTFVFLQAVTATFIRFFPKVKARYDYGILVFILTFTLVSVSGFRVDEIIEFAHKRLSTILIGGSACVIIAIFVYPVWAGQDLHNLIAFNLEKLGNFLEGFGDEYFKVPEDEEESEDQGSFMQAYKSVLNSKSNEESLANFARWEPGHGRFQFGHPWKQYLKVGNLTRQCAYRIEALYGYLNDDIKASVDVRSKIEEACTKVSIESGRALKELSMAIKSMTYPISAHKHIHNAKMAANNIKSLLKSSPWEKIELLQVIPLVTVASLLIDVVNCTEEIAESVCELASKARFKKVDCLGVSPETLRNVKSPRHADDHKHHLVISVDDNSSAPKISDYK